MQQQPQYLNTKRKYLLTPGGRGVIIFYKYIIFYNYLISGTYRTR